MDAANLEKLRVELEGLMRLQIESLARQTFLGITPEELEAEKDRLKRIREVSADFLAALKGMESQE
jgi:hypothetical protein